MMVWFACGRPIQVAAFCVWFADSGCHFCILQLDQVAGLMIKEKKRQNLLILSLLYP